MIIADKTHLCLHFIFMLSCFVSLVCGKVSDVSEKELSCKEEITECDESGIHHLHLNETWHFELHGTWTLALLKELESDIPRSDGATFIGYLSLTRIQNCKIKLSFQNVVFGTDRQKFSETLLVRVDRNSVWQVCREPKVNEVWISSEDRNERDDQLAGLASNVVSAITNNGMHESHSDKGRETTIEEDNFGVCPTHYEMKRTSRSDFWIRKHRDLKLCGKTFQKFASESGEVLWQSQPLESYVEKSEWECTQYYEHESLRRLECFHVVTMAETSEFTSNMTVTFVNAEKSSNTDSLGFVESYNFLAFSREKSGKEEQTELYEEAHMSLQTICQNSENGLHADAILSYPKTIATLNTLSRENIVKLYQTIKAGILCPENHYFMGIFESLLRDIVSPAASSAKCQIMLENDVPLNIGWASSLANTIQPTTETLKYCSDLLSLSSWTKSVLGVSALAGIFRSNRCHSQEKDYDSCDLGDNFHFIAKTLWLKAGNCLNPDKESQDLALWAIRGLTNLDSVGSHVTTTLMSCVNSPVATTEVKIASLKALGKKMCNSKTTSWIQSLVFKDDRSAEFRIEAFKTLFQCNRRVAEELIEIVSQGKLNLMSSQVTSFVDSYSKFKNGTNFFKLSRHFEFDFSGIRSLENKIKLEGDLIFDDSFLPRSLNLHLDSDMIKRFGGAAAQLEFRQKNLEDILQPLIGPEGLKDSLQSIVQDVILTFFDSLRNPGNESSDAPLRQKRSLNIEDVKTSLIKVKNKVTGKLHTMISIGLGSNLRHSSTYSFDPLFSNFDSYLQEYIDNIVKNLYSFITSNKMTSGFSWALRSGEVLSWSFLGRRLSLRQHEGIIATLKMSSHLSLFSLIKSPFNPSVDFKFNPNVGGYWCSSMEFAGNHKMAEAKLESPLQAGFSVHVKMKPKIEEHLEFHLDLPKDSFHGYSVVIAKELVVKNEIPTTGADPSHVIQLKKKGLTGLLVPKNSVKAEMEYLHCNEGFWDGLGLKSCFESSVWKGERSSLVHTKYGLAKADDNIQHFKISLSTKNPGENSFFLSALVETEGSAKKREGNVVFGFSLSPHTTLRILARGGNYTRSLEASVVNDWNLKRFEVRSNVDGEEHGMKAEILMVRDGGQVSIKPRLVVSRPTMMEDALLEGYMAHYSSDKVRSFTVDLLTQGSLKKVYDVALKGTTEYRWKPSGDWSLNLKNLHLISPGLDFGLESSFHVHESGAGISSQVTWDRDVVMLWADFLSSDVRENGGRHELQLHFLSPSEPLWDTKMTFITSLFDGQLNNNLTIINGPEASQWEFKAFHSTAWKFIYSQISRQEKAEDLSGRLLRKGRTVRIIDVIHISIPSDEIDIQLDHSFQASDYSIENQVSLLYRGVPYSIMTNFYDQSKEKFKYHMEIEMDFPEWKFSYVDTLLERNEGDIVGQSVATMPSGRIYTSSSRLKYENILNYLNLELTYDTHVRDGSQQFRISFRQALENTPNNLNFMISLETPDPVVGVELSLEGLGTQPVYLFLKAFSSGAFEVELTSRSTTSQTEVGLSIDLIPYSKLINSKVAVGRSLSGEGALDGEVVMTSPQNPSFQPVTLIVSSSLEIKDPGIYIVKSDLSVMGLGWSAELRTELGKKASDLQKFTVRVILPDKSSFEGESHLLLDFENEEQNVGCKTEIKLPSGVIYKLSIGGGSLFREGSLAEANLFIDINSPFTKEMFLRTNVRNHLSEGQRGFSFFCNTKSEARYWNEFQIDFKWEQEKESAKTLFVGKFGEKEVNLDSFGFYKIQNGTHLVKIVTEVHLRAESAVEQLKVSTEGELLSTLYPPGVKILQVTYVQKNYVEIFRSSGDLEVNIPETKGSLAITHLGGSFAHQEYKMQGTFDGQELKLSIHGMVENTPVRITLHYTDGETLKVFASYGGASFASMEFNSQLEGFSLRVRETSSAAAKVTTNGQITLRNRKTKFIHIFRVSQTHSSFNLQINSLRGKPVSIISSRTKISRNEWKTQGKLEWGRMRVTYNDEIAFRGFKDFDVKASFNAPAYGLRGVFFHAISSHHDATDQTLSIKYTREEVVIHSGSFSILTSSLKSNNPYEINAELVDIVIDKKKFSDFKFKQYLALLKRGIEVKSLLTRGETRLAEIGLSVSENKRKIVFAVCSMDDKCLRFTGQVHSFGRNSPIKNFDVEVKILNSLLWKKSDDDIIEHTIALSAEHKHKKGEDIRLAAKISRSLCNDELCEDSFSIGKHHIHLTASSKNMDVLYQTQNRTLLLKTLISKGFNKTLNEKDSKLLKIQLWFDRINKPDNVLIWTTSYQVYDSKAKMEEIVESVLHHPHVERPVSVSGKLSTFGNFKREAVIDLDIFEHPGSALQLYMLKDNREGGYNLQVDLKNIEDNQPHLSLSALFIPSPDAGFFDLRFNAPLLTSYQGSEDRNISFRYTCKMEVDQRNTQMLCQMNSTSVFEDFGLSFGQAPDPCSGATASSRVFENSYKAYGAYCPSPLNVVSGISLTDNDEQLKIKAGFVDSNEFEVDFGGVTKGDVKLFPPFLLQVSLQPVQTPHQRFMELKRTLADEWKYLVLRSKSTASKVIEDLRHFSEVFEAISKHSQMTEIVKICNHNSRRVLEELNNDELFQDISHTIEASVNVSSELLDEGISFVEDVIGSSLSMKSVSFYTSKLQEITFEMASTLLSALCKEVKWFEDYARDLIFETTSWIQSIYDYIANESVVSEPLKWLDIKLKNLLTLDVWPPLLHIWKETLHLTRQALSFFYSGIINEIAVKFSVLIPLPTNFYNLENVLLLPFGKDSRNYPALFLHEEIKRWIQLLLHPDELIEQTLPPYSAQGVVVRNNLITFDGRAHSIGTSCPHLLLALNGRNNTEIALASGRSQRENEAGNREFLLLVGKDTVRITPERRVDVNYNPISFPYQKGPFWIWRDLNQIEIVLKDSSKRRILSLSCGMNHNSCFIDVNGWLFSDVQGLLGTFDYDPFDDYAMPDGNVSLNGNIWEASWRITDNCSSAPVELVSLETDPDSKFKGICSSLLLDKNSFVVPCHSTVDVHPYYAVCVKSLQALQFTSKKNKRNTHHKIDSSSNHENDNANATTSYSSPLEEISFYDRVGKRTMNSTNDNFDFIWKRSRELLKLQPFDIKRKAMEAFCDIAFAYSNVCFKHKVALELPVECDIYPLKPRNDKVDLEDLSVDLLILFEEEKCISFVHNYILLDLYKDLRELLHGSSIHYKIQVGVIGYGSERDTPLTFYGGGSFLEPIEKVPTFLPVDLQIDQQRGTLEEAFVATNQFPFRKGSVRVIFVASCSDQDLSKISSALTKEMRKRRVIVFSLINAPLLHPRRTSEAVRNTIGIASRHIYHLKRGAVQRKTTMFIIPSSNIAHLSLQSGGGVFTVASVRQEKRFSYYMQRFRQIFIKALLESSEKVYASAKSRIRQNN